MPLSNTSSSFLARQARLADVLQSAHLDALALNPGPSLTYLTGLHFHLSERPIITLFMPGAAPLIVLPELESAKLKELAYPCRPSYAEALEDWAAAFHRAPGGGIDGKPVGVEPRRLRLLEFRFLTTAAPEADFVSAEDSLAALRMYKDAGEIAAMRKAAEIAQRALRATLPRIQVGVAEREIAAELTLQLLRAGSDSEIPFAPIVSSGPNSANPHATPGERQLKPGDLLVIDWGASFQGYFSDITRTFAIGEPEPEYVRIGQLVLEANTAGRLSAGPGISADLVDQATRSVIEQAGYGQYFIHRTGHGLGMEGHEEPYIRSGNMQTLEPGMTFTIEPGIYLPDRNGVRIEDDMVITESGAESLTDLPRQVIRLV
jgi:Xaa-Pro dipeptidase